MLDRREKVAMMTSGLIVQLDPDLPDREAAVVMLQSVHPFTVGEQRGAAVSVALEADDAGESERWLDWVRGLPGVVGVEVVFVHWDVAGGEGDDVGA